MAAFVSAPLSDDPLNFHLQRDRGIRAVLLFIFVGFQFQALSPPAKSHSGKMMFDVDDADFLVCTNLVLNHK